MENINEKILRKRIDDIGLPEDISSNLRWYGNIKTLKKLIETDVADLIKIYGIGEKKIEQIKSKLNELGLNINDSRPAPKPTKVSIRNTEFPYNIIEFIYQGKPNFKKPEVITQDIIDGIHFACLSLDERQQAALYLRFECQQTLEKIATRFSLSSTQITNIINKAILTWFKTGDIQYIEYGLKGYVNIIATRKAMTLTKVALIEEYKKGYEDGYKESLSNSQGNNEQMKFALENGYSVTVEEMGLSIRSCNFLNRAGIHTLLDLVDKTEEEMMTVRNLGRKSFEEISEKLAELGLGYRIENIEKNRESKEELHRFNINKVCKLDEIEFYIVDPMLSMYYTQCIYKEEGAIFCNITKEDSEHVEFYKYLVTEDEFEKFVEELLVENNVLEMRQDEFEYDDVMIHDDVSYTLKMSLNGENIEYRGGTSSRGVMLTRRLFEKYFLLPAGKKIDYLKMENIW